MLRNSAIVGLFLMLLAVTTAALCRAPGKSTTESGSDATATAESSLREAARPRPGTVQMAVEDVQAALDALVAKPGHKPNVWNPCADSDSLQIMLSPEQLTLRVPPGVHIIGPGSERCHVRIGEDFMVEDWPIFQNTEIRWGRLYTIQLEAAVGVDALIEGVTLLFPLLIRPETAEALFTAGKIQPIKDGKKGINYDQVAPGRLRGIAMKLQVANNKARSPSQRHTLRDVKLYCWTDCVQLPSQPGYMVFEDSQILGVQHVLKSPSPKGAAVRHITFTRTTLGGWEALLEQGYRADVLRNFTGHTWYGGDDMVVEATESRFLPPPGHEPGVSKFNAWTWRNKGSQAGASGCASRIERSYFFGQMATSSACSLTIEQTTFGKGSQIAVRGDLTLREITSDSLFLYSYDGLADEKRTLRIEDSQLGALGIRAEGVTTVEVHSSRIADISLSAKRFKQSPAPRIVIENSDLSGSGHLFRLKDGTVFSADKASVFRASTVQDPNERGKPYAMFTTQGATRINSEATEILGKAARIRK